MTSGQGHEIPEVTRLEALWEGEFGTAYTERNADAGKGRLPFWETILSEFPARQVLEIGCNLGANIRPLATLIPPRGIYGVDINEFALARLRSDLPQVNALWSPARSLPFRDNWFDLVFTAGVLIHQPESTLPLIMNEIVRCSRRFILCIEYYADETVAVPYREQAGALFKRNYGQLYRELFPQLQLLKEGFIPRDPSHSWDDATYWLFEKA